LNDIGRNSSLGNRKKLPKFLMRTFTCFSTFIYGLCIGAAAAPTTTAAPPATTTAAAAGAAAAGDPKAAVPGENCMPPAMYFMELMTCNSKIDEETERLFPALFATFEEEERQKLEDKLNKLKAVR
jgi:hypothetical protein